MLCPVGLGPGWLMGLPCCPFCAVKNCGESVADILELISRSRWEIESRLPSYRRLAECRLPNSSLRGDVDPGEYGLRATEYDRGLRSALPGPLIVGASRRRGGGERDGEEGDEGDADSTEAR